MLEASDLGAFGPGGGPRCSLLSTRESQTRRAKGGVSILGVSDPEASGQGGLRSSHITPGKGGDESQSWGGLRPGGLGRGRFEAQSPQARSPQVRRPQARPPPHPLPRGTPRPCRAARPRRPSPHGLPGPRSPARGPRVALRSATR